jgi:predicted O-methyltransferase YrrM
MQWRSRADLPKFDPDLRMRRSPIVTEIVTLPGGNRWQVGDTQFVSGFGGQSSGDCLVIQKRPRLVERYVEICKHFRHGAIVELGIAAGGSTALISLLAQPRKLVACELHDKPVDALSEFIDTHGASATVRPFYGVNQSDRARLAEIIDTEFPDQRLDLVIDDASHLYHETRASFEVLYPRLRPGGIFVIEDWKAARFGAKLVIAAMEDRSSPDFAEREQRLADAIATPEQLGSTPLHFLGLELLQACAATTDVMSEITFNQNWIVARRGTAELDPATFCISDHYADDWDWTSV